LICKRRAWRLIADGNRRRTGTKQQRPGFTRPKVGVTRAGKTGWGGPGWVKNGQAVTQKIYEAGAGMLRGGGTAQFWIRLTRTIGQLSVNRFGIDPVFVRPANHAQMAQLGDCGPGLQRKKRADKTCYGDLWDRCRGLSSKDWRGSNAGPGPIALNSISESAQMGGTETNGIVYSGLLGLNRKWERRQKIWFDQANTLTKAWVGLARP